MTRRAPCIAVLGLGEAGTEIARDLARAGALVRAYDPRVVPADDLVACANEAEAARGADLVLSVNSAEDAEDALLAGLPGLAGTAVWCDLNTSSPALKQRLTQLAGRAGRSLVDVALMSPVPGRGLRTPMLAAGPGADVAAALLIGLGAHVEVLAGPPGTAATRKLLRSVFFKGLAAAVVEALEGARAAGCEVELRADIARELSGADEQTVQRLEHGTYRHAARREREMAAASELLDELGVPPRVSRASQQWLAQLAAAPPPGPGPSAKGRRAGGPAGPATHPGVTDPPHLGSAGGAS